MTIDTVIRSVGAGVCLVLGILFLASNKPVVITCGAVVIILGCFIVFDRS